MCFESVFALFSFRGLYISINSDLSRETCNIPSTFLHFCENGAVFFWTLSLSCKPTQIDSTKIEDHNQSQLRPKPRETGESLYSFFDSTTRQTMQSQFRSGVVYNYSYVLQQFNTDYMINIYYQILYYYSYQHYSQYL